MYLCVQITSVFCESFFSFAGKILTPERTSMDINNFRRLAIMKANENYISVDKYDFKLSWAALEKSGIVKETIHLDLGDAVVCE